MVDDYDWVVLGGSPEGRWAAALGAQLGARVALVEPDPDRVAAARVPPPFAEALVAAVGAREALASLPLRGLVFDNPESRNLEFPTLGSLGPDPFDREPGDRRWPPVSLPQVRAWGEAAAAVRSPAEEWAALAALGVDTLRAAGRFLPSGTARRSLRIAAGDRELRARRALLAPARRAIVPDLPGLAETGYLLPETLDELSKPDRPLPRRWVVLGGSPAAVELAQALRRLGSAATLALRGDRLLPDLDGGADAALRRSLEAAGVEVLLSAPADQVRAIDACKWVQAGDRALEADEILVAAGYRACWPAGLENLGLRPSPRGLPVGATLQTAHPAVYACGSACGGYPFAAAVRWEAETATRHALCGDRPTADRAALPRSLAADPPLAWTGLSAAAARDRYGSGAIALDSTLAADPQTAIAGGPAGFVRLVLAPDGRVVGGSFLGPRAEAVIAPIALAVQARLTADWLAEGGLAEGAGAAAWRDLARRWQPTGWTRWRAKFRRWRRSRRVRL